MKMKWKIRAMAQSTGGVPPRKQASNTRSGGMGGCADKRIVMLNKAQLPQQTITASTRPIGWFFVTRNPFSVEV